MHITAASYSRDFYYSQKAIPVLAYLRGNMTSTKWFWLVQPVI